MLNTARTLCVILAAAAAVAAGATQAAAAAPPLVAADASRPSAIEVSNGTTYVANGPDGRQNVACIVFVNHGPRLATKVGLSLAMMDATGAVFAAAVADGPPRVTPGTVTASPIEITDARTLGRFA